MSTVQGLHTRVNLKNGDIFYGYATQVDDDGSISLEKAKRCFMSGRVSEYAFMKVPGHSVLDYYPTVEEQPSSTVTGIATQTTQSAQHQEQSPIPPLPLSGGHAFPPPPPPPAPASDSQENVNCATPRNSSTSYPETCLSSSSNQQSSFVDPAIISISSTDAQEKKLGLDKRSNKKQGKVNKGKKNTDTLAHSDSLDSPSAPTPKSQKSKRGNKNKQQQQQQQQQQASGGPFGENNDGSTKPVKSPPKSKNGKKQASKKQQQQQQQHLEQQPHQQEEQTKKQQPPIQQHVMPQFGNKTAPRKLVDTVVYDDFNDFIDTSRENQGHSIGLTNNQDSTYKNNKHQVRKNQDDQQTPVVLSPSHTAPETSVLPSQLHKPDDAVNQVATQSLLSSLNMVPMAAFAKSLAGTSPPSSSSVVSDRSQSTSVSYQHQSPTSIMSPVQKISTANQGFKMPFPMPKPSICTSDNNSNYDNINGSSNNGTPFLLQQEMDGGFSDNEKGITPTKTLVPVLPDVTAMDSTMLATSSNSSPMITHHQEHQVTSPPAERLQKPMEHEHTVPIITNGNNSHANAYDGPVIKSVATGAVCPVLSAQLLSRLIQITKSETGLNDSMIIENAAHAATSITFKAIGGQRRVQQKNHNDAPIVVILAGNHSVGCYGIATARHLANRGIQVVVLLASTELGTQVKEQKRCAQFAGVTFVDGIDELPDPLTAPVDLIIDALMGSVITMVDLKKNQMDRTLLWQGIDWANGNKAPVLSLDYPSGVNSEDGHPFHVMHYILPKWTLCFGAPIEGCVSNKVTGGLFVADLGIPAVSWQRIGIKKRGLPWGAESVMPLEYE